MENLKIINGRALTENILKFQDKKLCAMVKCSAYGHGTKQIVMLAEPNVDMFGVASANEGILVRKFTNKPVIVFGAEQNLQACKRHNLQFIVDDEASIRRAIKLGLQESMHLKIDCGMNRFGVKNEISLRQIDNLLQSEGIKLNSVCTHFPCTENKRETEKHYKRFLELKSFLTQNSPVCLGGSGVHSYNFDYQILRLGIGMYGYGQKHLLGVMRLTSYVKKVYFLRRGSAIGYGGCYTVQKDGFFAVVPVGYGDGLRRNLSGKFSVKINGKSFVAVGNICMDCFFVKVDKSVKEGDTVEVFDNANKFAKICGTIPYEILTGFCSFRGKTILENE